MEILIITHNYPIGAQERSNAGIFVHDFATQLARTNKVTVVCPSSFDKKTQFGSVTVYFFNWRGGKHLGKLKFYNPLDLFYGFKLFIRGFKVLSRVAKEIKPDFSLAMWAVPGGIFAYLMKIKFSIPYAVWVLGSDFYVYSKIPMLGFLIRYVLKMAKYIFADGISLAHEVSSATGKKCLFLPSSTKFESPKIKKKIRSRPKDMVTLTFVGRMELTKGPDILLDALIQVLDELGKDRVKNFKINFLGEGSLLPALKERAQTVALEENIIFYGNVHVKKKIVQVLYDSDWLIIPSRSDSIPLVFSEGMKVGIPVVTSALPDLKYLVDKYSVGIHFKPGDYKSLARILLRLPLMRKEHSIFNQNTKRAAKIFSLEESASRFLEIVS